MGCLLEALVHNRKLKLFQKAGRGLARRMVFPIDGRRWIISSCLHSRITSVSLLRKIPGPQDNKRLSYLRDDIRLGKRFPWQIARSRLRVCDQAFSCGVARAFG